MDMTLAAGLFVVVVFMIAVGVCTVLMTMVAFNMSSGGDGTTRTRFTPAVYQPMQMLLARAAAQHGAPALVADAAAGHAKTAAAA